MSRVDLVERWRVLFPGEREILTEALEQLIEHRRGSDYWLPEQRFLGRMLKQLREVEQRPRPKILWWDKRRVVLSLPARRDKHRADLDELLDYVDRAKIVAQRLGRVSGEPLDRFLTRLESELP